MKLRVGQTLTSPVDTTTVIVVRAPSAEVDLTCAGVPMAAKGAPAPADATAHPEQLGGSLLGKRYVDDDLGLELLCTKGGEGSLALNGVPLAQRETKALPTSD